jgi:hypothetical protein
MASSFAEGSAERLERDDGTPTQAIGSSDFFGFVQPSFPPTHLWIGEKLG